MKLIRFYRCRWCEDILKIENKIGQQQFDDIEDGTLVVTELEKKPFHHCFGEPARHGATNYLGWKIDKD